LVHLPSTQSIESHRIIQISGTSDPKLKENQILWAKDSQAHPQDRPDDRQAKSTLCRKIPSPQPIDLDSIEKHTQPCDLCLCANFQKAGSPFKKELLELGKPGGWQ